MDKKALLHLAGSILLAPGLTEAAKAGAARQFSPIYAKIKNGARTNAVFLRAFLKSPGSVGSLCPSSHQLAGAMVAEAFARSGHEAGLYIDLGVGSGIVTEHLLANGIPPHRILGVEISETFAKLYKKRFANINIVNGDARNLGEYLRSGYGDSGIAAIISSLPLRSLPGRDVAIIMSRLRRLLLCRGGVFVQFTYALWMRAILRRYGLCLLGHRYVFHNLPPAMIEIYAPVQAGNI